jgi:hypothetical protein
LGGLIKSLTLRKYVVAVGTGVQLRVTVEALMHVALRPVGGSGRSVITGAVVVESPVAGGVDGVALDVAPVDAVPVDGGAGVICAGSE